MLRPQVALLLALLALAPDAAAAQEVSRGELVSLRFGWPAPARARVSYRRTRVGTGRPRATFTARYDLVVEDVPDALRVSMRRTTWRGDLPVPAALAGEAIRASEKVAQRVGPEGEFLGLEGVEALRPVLARVLDRANVPPDQAERALAVALGATRSEAEELWNLAVGFWIGADLRIAEIYAMQSDAELPLVPGFRAGHEVEFSVRRRVPCAAVGEQEPRCVEAVLRAVADRAAVERAARQLLARILPQRAEPREDAAKDLTVESELVLVTDPTTLLPRRVVWTKAVRLGAREKGPPDAEQLERAEYDYRWLPQDPPPQRRAKPSPVPEGEVNRTARGGAPARPGA